MNNYYKPQISLEPTDKYLKAKKDLIEAYKSFQELSPEEQCNLAREACGAGRFEMLCNLMQFMQQNFR